METPTSKDQVGEIVQNRKRKTRTGIKITAEGWREVTASNRFFYTELERIEAFAILDLKKDATILDIFLKFMTPS